MSGHLTRVAMQTDVHLVKLPSKSGRTCKRIVTLPIRSLPQSITLASISMYMIHHIVQCRASLTSQKEWLERSSQSSESDHVRSKHPNKRCFDMSAGRYRILPACCGSPKPERQRILSKSRQRDLVCATCMPDRSQLGRHHVPHTFPDTVH